MNVIQTNYRNNCPKHPEYRIEMMKLSKFSNNQVFYCLECMEEEESFSQKNFIQLKKIIEQGEDQIIPKWPPLENQKIIENLITEINQNSKDDQLVQKIDSYFDEFTKEILAAVTHSKKKVMRVIEEFSLQEDQILKQYQSISKIIEVRQILINNNITVQEKEKNCMELIEKLNSDKSKNSENLQRLYLQLTSRSDLINFQILNAYKQSCLVLINDLSSLTINSGQVSSSNQLKTGEYVESVIQLLNLQSSQQYKPENITVLKNIFSYISPIIEETLKSQKLPPLSQKQTLPQLQNKPESLDKSAPLSQFQEIKNNQIIIDRKDQLVSGIQKEQKAPSQMIPNLERVRSQEILSQKMDLLQNNILPSISFSQINIKNTENNLIEFRNNNDSITLRAIQKQEDGVQCISNFVINSKSSYIFRFKLECRKNNQSFALGLISDAKVTLQQIKLNLGCCLKQKNNQIQILEHYGKLKALKGNYLLTNSSNELLEVRISLSSTIFEITNYPSYNNHVILDDKFRSQIKDVNDLKFFLFMVSDDIELTLTDAFIQ